MPTLVWINIFCAPSSVIRQVRWSDGFGAWEVFRVKGGEAEVSRPRCMVALRR